MLSPPPALGTNEAGTQPCYMLVELEFSCSPKAMKLGPCMVLKAKNSMSSLLESQKENSLNELSVEEKMGAIARLTEPHIVIEINDLILLILMLGGIGGRRRGRWRMMAGWYHRLDGHESE